MAAPISVLIILPALFGGGGRTAIELCKALEKERIEASIFLSLGSGELAAEAESRGVKTHRLHRGGGAGAARALFLLPVLIVRLLRLARRRDILVGGGDAADHLLALLAGRLLRKPALGIIQVTPSANIKSYRGLGRRLLSLSTRIALPRLDATISVAQAVRDDAIDLGARRERAFTIPNGVSVARVQELSTAEEIVFAQPTIVGVGRLAHEKGFDTLLRAHALARRKIAHELVLVGDGRERASLERLTAELGIDDSVTFAGYQANPYPWIAAADLVCLPSRHEASPLIVPEALVLRRPVVATDCPGGTRESLADGRFGRLVPCEDPEALADALAEHLKNPSKLRALARAAQVEIEQSRDQPATAARYAEVLRQALDDHRGRSSRRQRARVG